MCFDILILTSLLPNNIHREENVQVRAEEYNKDEEAVLFFHIDTPKARKDLGIQGEICDLVVYYSSTKRRSICFVELKGSDIAHAINQIVNTYNYFRQTLYDSVQANTQARANLHKIVWKACIRFSGSAPQDIKKHQGKLDKLFPGNWQIEPYRGSSRRDSNEDISTLIKS